jgi:LCP family protein required for cell wall assembly
MSDEITPDSAATDSPVVDEAAAKHRHTRGQKVLVTFNVLVAFALVISGAILFWAGARLSSRKVVAITHSSSLNGNAGEDAFANLDSGDLSAQNFLITGTDNNACIPKDSKYYGTLEGREGLGERSDTIMIIRANPSTEQAAILSFPRDLWVKIAGSNHSSKLNSAFDRQDPNRLIQTIEENFGIPIQHYVNVDFCAFMSLVDALGGIKIPFEYAVKDSHTQFEVAAPGCVQLSGIDALQYARSRYYYYWSVKQGDWVQDPSSDRGRIARQQDFVRRLIQRAIDKGARSPRVANKLINIALDNVITDRDLTTLKLLQLGKTMRTLDSRAVRTYMLDGKGQYIGNSAVIVPDTTSTTAKQILAIFRGEANLSTQVEQNLAGSINAPAPTTTISPFAQTTTTTPGQTTTTSSTLPVVEPEQVPVGLVPPRNSDCH